MLLFVYGTLTPGHAPACVADLVSRFRPIGRALVRGTLLNLGEYPGLVSRGEGVVFGMLVEAPADPVLLRRLDAYEGYKPTDPGQSLFCRVDTLATLESGQTVDCQTYTYNGTPTAGRVVASGDWFHQDVTLDQQPLAPSVPAEFSMRKRPLIGITSGNNDDKPTRYEIPADYARSVELAGGLPVILPFRSSLSMIPDYVDRLDGIVFIGGDDLDPALYGETRHRNAVQLDMDRQRFELALLAEVERRRLPTLGICLGSQLINVHRGGSLHQFLPELDRPDALEHRFRGDSSYRHDVSVKSGTVLADVVGKPSLTVNSRHKQAVNQLGQGLRVSALASDGVIEAFEDPSLPMFVAIQWHPENLAPEDGVQLNLFKRLVEVASKAEKSSS